MGTVNQSLCRDQHNQPTYGWCTYEAIDDYTIIVEIVFMLSLIMLAILVGRYIKFIFSNHRRMTLKLLSEETIVQVFALVTIWLTCSISKVIINLVFYYLEMRQDFQEQKTQYFNEQKIDRNSLDSFVIFSSVFQFLDYMCGCILLFLMLLIPYTWLKQALMNTNQNKQISIPVRKKISKIFTILNILKLYSKIIMISFPLFLLSQPFLLYFTQIGCKMPQYNAYFMYTQSIIVLLLYIFVFSCFKIFKKYELLQLSSEHLSRIKKQYFLLLLVLLVRMGLNYYFKLSKIYKYQPNQNCTDKVNKIPATIFLAVGQFIMHFLPIVVIVCVYKPHTMPHTIPHHAMVFQSQSQAQSVPKSKQSLLTPTFTQEYYQQNI